MMLYLDKLKSIMINRPGLKGQGPKHNVGSLKLSFCLDEAEGQLVEKQDGAVPRAIIKVGNDYAYAVGYGFGKITGAEQKCIECAKCAAVEKLSKSEDALESISFEAARASAYDALSASLGQERARYLSYLVAYDTAGYGPLGILLSDRESLEEIEINVPCSNIKVYHVKYGRCNTNLRFSDEKAFRHSINRLIADTDKELSEDTPIVEAQVEDARIHAQIRPYALSGAAASIRLGRGKVVSIDYLLNKSSVNCDILAYLWLAFDSGINMIVSGPPASGKTTLLSALFSFVPRYEKIITIEEDINELKIRLDISNTVSLYGSKYRNSISTRDQVLNALRMRPSRIVLGEVRGEETKELFSCANLGVPFITTMHSNEGGVEVLKKLLVKPMAVEAKSLSMLDVVLYMKSIDISRRVLSEIYEYKWLSRAETENLGIEIEGNDSVDIAELASNGILNAEALKSSKVVNAFSRKKGLSTKLVVRELEKRSKFLRELCSVNRTTDDIMASIQNY